MKVVLFCGGQGMRLREFSDRIPKPMVPIGPRPIIWHLMKYYAHYGHKDFILCLGYKGDVIKEYFLNYKEWLSNDFVIREGGRDLEMMRTDIDDWQITFVDTGLNANIGERLVAVRDHVGDDEVFLANYSDGLTDLHLPDLIERFHHTGATATFMCTTPSQTFHVVSLDSDDRVLSLREASEVGIWVNAGYFVLSRDVFDYIETGEELVLEPFERLAAEGRLTALRHDGFWTGMDTFKDLRKLDDLYAAGAAPWMNWTGTGADRAARQT